jgi:HAD superfamily hydrolase (TIGR01484 family)
MTVPPAWCELATEQARKLRGVLTDIDDTLTRAGTIEPVALDALRRLADAGVPVVAITGRPTGWCEALARDWPLAAIVAENGAVALIPEADGMRIEFEQDEATRASNTARLRAVAERILSEVPDARLARDSAGRVTDIAIDHGEFEHLDRERIDRVVRLMQDAGMVASVSSIHINGWFGAHNKLSGARWIVQRLYGRDLDAERDRWVYVGDSTNDQEMFDFFPISVGVANLLRFQSDLRLWPTYLTQRERGAGFAEVADTLLRARS